MKRLILPGVVAAVVVIAFAWWFALSRPLPGISTAREPSSPTTSKRNTNDAARGSAVIAIPDHGTIVALPATLPAVVAKNAIRDQIRDATDLRALYDRTKDMPDPTGERAYRFAEAIFECSVFADSSAEELSARLAINKAARESARRQEVFSFMVERCKGFAGSPATLREMTQALHRRAEASGYPAEIARSLRFEAGTRDPERADQIAIGLLANPDADVIHELAQYMNLRNMYVPQFRTGEAATRSVAWGLLECEYGGDCGPRSRPVVMTCITLGACDLQRVEEAVIAQSSQAVVNNAVLMRDRLARQIAAGDWAAVGFVERFKAP